MWHANPALFKESACPNPFAKEISAAEIRDQDAKRVKILKEKGFKVLVIWEKDVKENREAMLHTCLEFLNEE